MFVGLATASIGPAVATYTILIIVGSLVSIPLFVAILTVIYRGRVGTSPPTAARSGAATTG